MKIASLVINEDLSGLQEQLLGIPLFTHCFYVKIINFDTQDGSVEQKIFRISKVEVFN